MVLAQFVLFLNHSPENSINEREREWIQVKESETDTVPQGNGCRILQHFGFKTHISLTRDKAQQFNFPPAFRA